MNLGYSDEKLETQQNSYNCHGWNNGAKFNPRNGTASAVLDGIATRRWLMISIVIRY